MKRILAALVVVLLTSYIQGQTFDCPPLDGYDIKNLTIPSYWQFDLNSTFCLESTESPCHFYFTFCKFLPSVENTTCVNSSVCQFSSESSSPLEIGHYKENAFIPKETNGFFVDFKGPQVSHKGKLCNISIKMEFDCNSNKPWIPDSGPSSAPEPSEYILNSSSCHYYIKFDYAGACHKIVPPTTKITTTSFNPTPAKICKSKDGHNISLLIDPPYWIFNITDGCYIESNVTKTCQLFMAFCKPIEDLNGCKDSSVCLKYNLIPPKYVVVGAYTENPFIQFRKNSFVANYSHGEEIINPNTGETCNIKIEVAFECDKSANWKKPEGNQPGISPFPTHFSPIGKTCQLKMKVPYKGACNVNSGLSAGSVLIIIFLIFCVVYFGFGFGYNIIIIRETGLHSIPNYKFWSFIFDSSLKGLYFTWNFITCQSKKEKLLKYDSI